MPYRITYALDLFNGPGDRSPSHETLTDMLDLLVRIDTRYLIKHPKTPLIYQSGVRYMEEPPGQEDWQDIPTTLAMGIGDCLPISTLILRDDYSFSPIIELKPGDKIMSDGEMTTVTECLITGQKPILSFGLDNGCNLRVSPEHKLFTSEGKEIRAEDVRVGERLLAPSKPFPTAVPYQPDDRIKDTDLAWLMGTYIADGWHDNAPQHRFSISGFDENPKRKKIEQKERVVSICDASGIGHRWHKKYVAVNDKPLTEIMRTCGSHAPIKKVPTMLWSKEQVLELINGLQSDCSTANSGNLTHGTTSAILALQLRILYRMLDQSVHIRCWSAEEHRGLGKNSIYRIGVRRPANDDMKQNWKTRSEQFKTSVRVRSIKEDKPELCADITTEAGMFYLPESDTIVHNCEDLACWRTAELNVRFNIPAKAIFKEQRRRDGGYLFHILVRYPDGRIEDPSRILGMR